LLDETVMRALGRRKLIVDAAIDSTWLECSAASYYFVKRRVRIKNLKAKKRGREPPSPFLRTG